MALQSEESNMRNGILFFFNMGKITMIARVAIIPIIFMIMRSLGQVFWFFFYCALLVLAMILGLIPAPSDRSVMLLLDRHKQDFDKMIQNKCNSSNSESAMKLDGYRVKGRMILKRHKGTKMIYPHPAFFAIAKGADKQYWFFASSFSLTNKKPPKILCCPLKSNEYEISAELDGEDFSKTAYLTLKCEMFPNGESFVVDRNYRLRDFIAQVKEAQKQ